MPALRRRRLLPRLNGTGFRNASGNHQRDSSADDLPGLQRSGGTPVDAGESPLQHPGDGEHRRTGFHSLSRLYTAHRPGYIEYVQDNLFMGRKVK